MTTTIRPFNSHMVLEEKIAEPFFRAYHVGFDQKKFRLVPLVDKIWDVVPEFALGFNHGTSIPVNDVIPRLREAVRRIYTTDQFQKRGEFGELILHLLLRDFCGSIPLVSKIYFKDASNETVHGFDGVHVVVGEKKKLWLGESKIYHDGRAGITDLCKSLKTHLTAEYLTSEFALIRNKMHEEVPDIEHWRNLMDSHQRLDVVLDGICLPMVCTYSCDIFNKHIDNTPEYVTDFLNHCRGLRDLFNEKREKTSVEIILMLLPVPSKEDLVSALHERLKAAQKI